VDDRWIGASKEGLEREASTRMPQIPCDETRTTPWAGPHRVFASVARAQFTRSGCDPDTPFVRPRRRECGGRRCRSKELRNFVC
jgi:hypothetical protein